MDDFVNLRQFRPSIVPKHNPSFDNPKEKERHTKLDPGAFSLFSLYLEYGRN
jgi:hypothetical protein